MPRRLSIVAVVAVALLVSGVTLVLAVRLATPSTVPSAPTTSQAAATTAAAAAADGDGGDGYELWEVRADGSPVRWNPCAPIPWVLKVDGAPDGARGLIEEALARLTAETGVEFEYLGPTDEEPTLQRPVHQRERYPDRWAPVLVAWGPPHLGDIPLRDSDRGVALPVAVDGVFVSGQIVLNDRRQFTMDFSDRAGSWGATVLHEFVHILGLDHVDDPDQLMHRFAGSGPVQLADGDRAGLERLTSSSVCLDAGPPRYVRVTVRPRR